LLTRRLGQQSHGFCQGRWEAVRRLPTRLGGPTPPCVKVPRPPPASSPAVTAVMKANRARNTGPELALRKSLRDAGIRGYRLSPPGIPGRPDITFPRLRLAAFVHGCFWHQHGCRTASHRPKTNISYWNLKFALNRTRDAKKIASLQNSGWRVLTFWECEINRDAAQCARRVTEVLDRPRRLIPKAIYPAN